MAKIQHEEVIGYERDNKLYCLQCAKEESLKEIKFEEVLSLDYAEQTGRRFFCDTCGKEMTLS